MPDLNVLNLFRESGALLEGHFRLSSGLHSAGYLQSALVLQHPAHAETLGRALAGKLDGLRANAVLSPALGGLIIGHEVSKLLCRDVGTLVLVSDRIDLNDGGRTLRS